MFTGFMTLYMLELGVTLTQVGMIASLGMLVHIFFALISTYITDKFGRVYTTLVFDILGWGLTLLIWAVAQNVYFFIAAAFTNAMFRVVSNSWQCMILEDSEPDSRVHIFNFLHMASIIGGFFTPFGAVLINRMELVPAMRVMLFGGFISLMTMFIVRHFFVTETQIGRQKMQEMKGVSIFSAFGSYIPVLKRIIADRLLVIAILIRALNFVQLTVRTTFLAVLVTQGLNFPAEVMALFHTLNAVVMLLVLLFITPALARFTRRWPISFGLWCHLAATAVLLLSPMENYPLLIVSAVLIALGTGIATPRIDALVANTINNEDRSVANVIMSICIMTLTAPFAYAGGLLSEVDARLPFVMTFGLFVLCLMMLRLASVVERRQGLPLI